MRVSTAASFVARVVLGLLCWSRTIAGIPAPRRADDRSVGLLRVDVTDTPRAEPVEPLRVHIVPHSHDDSGWLKTYLEYYWGDKQYIQQAGVKTILDSVIEALVVDASRRFSFAEMSFFMLWWRQQTDQKKAIVRRLVASGQLDFVNGGFVQHDEAAAHYVAMIDQTTRGHRFLKEEFGFVPRVGWQIDPFGHSSTQAGLMGKALGFDALFFGRADWEDMNVRKERKQLEFLWRGTGAGPMTCDTSDADVLFTGNFASGNYGPPEGFNFEFSISDEPIQDDPRARGFNVDEKVAAFVERCEELAALTRGNDIMFTMGSDFHYSAAEGWFGNLDKLMRAVNARFAGNGTGTEHGLDRSGHRKIEVFYSTPYEYVKAKAMNANTTMVAFPIKEDDFFPYSDAQQAFWTGYYTSRPTSKRYIRLATSFLQAARQLEVYYEGQRGDAHRQQRSCVRGTDPLEEAVALCQHHDSITGTERQAVADDYHVWISEGIAAAQEVVVKALKAMYAIGDDALQETDALPLVHDSTDSNADFVFCPLLNVSMCDFTVDRDAFTVTVYNPTSFEREIPVSVPVSLQKFSDWRVLGPGGQMLHTDVVKLWDDRYVGNKRKKKKRRHQADVVFIAPVQPMGMSSFLISGVESGDSIAAMDVNMNFMAPVDGFNESSSISNAFLRLDFHPVSGLAESITFPGTNHSMPFSFDLFWYNSSDGMDSNINRGQSSGAYIFRPNGRYPLNTGHNVTLDIVQGDVVSEARQTFNAWGSIVTRIFKDKPYLEVEWTVGPLPLDEVGREVVIAYQVPDALSELWTDANGRAMIRRPRNARFSWKSRYADAIAANYYPITSAAVLQDATSGVGAALTLLTDRAQGAASPQDGELQVMLHRRTVKDDGRGVEEPLNEQQCDGFVCEGLVARGRHHILLEDERSAHSAARRRQLQQEMNDDPVIVFSHAALYERSPDELRSQSLMRDAKGHAAFAFPLHVLTLQESTNRTSSQRTLILRVAHQMDDVNTLDGGRPRWVDLADLVDLVRGAGCRNMLAAREVSLSTNQDIHDGLIEDRPRFQPGNEAIGSVACERVYFRERRAPNVADDVGGNMEFNNMDHPWTMTNGRIRFDPMEIKTFEIVCGVS